jgi:hypothetical protein
MSQQESTAATLGYFTLGLITMPVWLPIDATKFVARKGWRALVAVGNGIQSAATSAKALVARKPDVVETPKVGAVDEALKKFEAGELPPIDAGLDKPAPEEGDLDVASQMVYAPKVKAPTKAKAKKQAKKVVATKKAKRTKRAKPAKKVAAKAKRTKRAKRAA